MIYTQTKTDVERQRQKATEAMCDRRDQKHPKREATRESARERERESNKGGP